MADLGNILARFGVNPVRVRLVADVFSLLEGDAAMSSTGGVAGLSRRNPTMPGAEGVDARGAEIESIAAELDHGERYAGVATPARTALSLYDAHIEWSPGIQDLEDEHGRDAVVRLVGLGLVAEALCDGGSDEAAVAWLESESGRACLVWFSAVEVVLAYGTEDDAVDGDKLLDLLDTFFDDAIEDWTGLASDTGLARARIIVNNWTDVLCPAITAAADRVSEIADVVRDALGDGGDVDGLVTEALDLSVYRSLVARHVGEAVNGLVVPTESTGDTSVEETKSSEQDEEISVDIAEEASVESNDSTAAEAKVAQYELKIDTQRGALEAFKQALTATRGAGKQTDERVETIGKEIESLTEHRTSVRMQLEDFEKRRSELSAPGQDEPSAKIRLAAVAAQDTFQAAKEAYESAVASQSELQTQINDSGSTLRSSRSQSRKAARACLDAVDAHRRLGVQRLVWLREVNGLTERILKGVLSESEAVHEQRHQTKAALSELRKERRRLGKSTATTTRQEGALQKQLDERMAIVDASRLMAREARDEVKRYVSKRKASESALTKRVEREGAVLIRQTSTEAKVEEVSQVISDLREELRELMTQVDARRAEDEAERQSQLIDLRKRRQAAEAVLEDGRSWLPKMKEQSKAMRAQITVLINSERDAIAARDEASRTLKTLQKQRKSEQDKRENEAELAVAALEMLKANARRLEESHVGYREAQATLDRFFKEQNLATSQKESLDRDIELARSAEVEAGVCIESCEAALVQTKSNIEANLVSIGNAKESAEKARVQRITALEAKIAECRSYAGTLNEAHIEAQEDHHGLIAAENKVVSALEALQANRVAAVKNKDALVGRQSKQRKEHTLALDAVRSRRAMASSLHSEIKGLGLTLRGLISERDARQKRMQQSAGRIEHLQVLVEAAKHKEEEAVEEVADFQSWVDRSRASLARSEVAIAEAKKQKEDVDIPSPPVVPVGPSKSESKIERLLAELKKEREEPRPLNSEATMMLDREHLIAQAAADDEATRILSTSATATPASTEDDDDDATVMFSPEELRKRLEEELETDETVVFVRTDPAKKKETE